MDFKKSVETFFKKYATFQGRASRSEFWYIVLLGYGTIALFNLFDVKIYPLLFLLDNIIIYTLHSTGSFYILAMAQILGAIFSVVTFILWIPASARRLHDIGRSGWWLLISAIPFVGIIGGIVLIVWWCTEGEKKKNKYGKPIRLKR